MKDEFDTNQFDDPNQDRDTSDNSVIIVTAAIWIILTICLVAIVVYTGNK